jgi:hypothetical protein
VPLKIRLRRRMVALSALKVVFLLIMDKNLIAYHDKN